MSKQSQRFKQNIIEETNRILKYWSNITVDPEDPIFLKDLSDICNILFSVNLVNNQSELNSETLVANIAGELARKTLKTFIKKFSQTEQKYKVELQKLEHWKGVNLETSVDNLDTPKTTSILDDVNNLISEVEQVHDISPSQQDNASETTV